MGGFSLAQHHISNAGLSQLARICIGPVSKFGPWAAFLSLYSGTETQLSPAMPTRRDNRHQCLH